MGNYDYIISPVSGQPVSKSQFGDTVITAINDLDRRISAFDGSTGIAVASSTAVQNLAATTEVVALTIASFTFRAGFAYRAVFRAGVASTTAGLYLNYRVRKTNAAGTDYGEFFRTPNITGNPVASALGTIYLLRTAGTDLTTDVCLTVQPGSATAITNYANASSPRFLIIEPAGFASSYAGLGIAVT